MGQTVCKCKRTGDKNTYAVEHKVGNNASGFMIVCSICGAFIKWVKKIQVKSGNIPVTNSESFHRMRVPFESGASKRGDRVRGIV